ncbi:MAG: hypothetical protein MUE96_04850 [Bacteroidia bacterium]|jgi:hypothetical protein|nr:hypothetical protein [Bacteroidia bacterium]
MKRESLIGTWIHPESNSIMEISSMKYAIVSLKINGEETLNSPKEEVIVFEKIFGYYSNRIGIIFNTKDSISIYRFDNPWELDKAKSLGIFIKND